MAKRTVTRKKHKRKIKGRLRKVKVKKTKVRIRKLGKKNVAIVPGEVPTQSIRDPESGKLLGRIRRIS